MNIEYEAKFLNVDSVTMGEKLLAIGAKPIHARILMKRVLFDHPLVKNAFIRIRDEWDYITMTWKLIDNHETVNGMKEIEIKVDDFNNAKSFINFLGIETRSYQETYREKRQLDDIVFSIDEWPGISPFLEIEGSNEDVVRGISAQLGMDFKQAYFGAVDVIYETVLGISKEELNSLKLITFDDPPYKGMNISA